MCQELRIKTKCITYYTIRIQLFKIVLICSSNNNKYSICLY